MIMLSWIMTMNGSDFLVTYEEMLMKYDDTELIIREKPLCENDGRIKKNRIAIRKDIETTKEKSCILAEEIGHYFTSSGNILDQSDTMNRKQEYRARLYGYNLKVGITGIIKAYEKGCRNLYEMAKFLDCTEKYLVEALNCYRSKYGCFTTIDNYIVYFIPTLSVMKMIG